MTTLETPTAEILERGYRALLRELGPAGFIQFVQHFEKGTGDYTADRHRWLTQSVDEIFNMLESKAVQPGDAP
ncbi:MAG: hypothetical protein SH850_16280 [Planctomycetaceae bacterium]|nr:hypothetical protein [Planctomycetaceae bacterium]